MGGHWREESGRRPTKNEAEMEKEIGCRMNTMCEGHYYYPLLLFLIAALLKLLTCTFGNLLNTSKREAIGRPIVIVQLCLRKASAKQGATKTP